MSEQKNRWSWDVAGFDTWKSFPPSPPAEVENGDRKPTAPLLRPCSILASSVLPQHKHSCFRGFRFSSVAGVSNDDLLRRFGSCDVVAMWFVLWYTLLFVLPIRKVFQWFSLLFRCCVSVVFASVPLLVFATTTFYVVSALCGLYFVGSSFCSSNSETVSVVFAFAPLLVFATTTFSLVSVVRCGLYIVRVVSECELERKGSTRRFCGEDDKMSCIRYFAQLAKEDYLQLRQEASELQEYSNAKLDRVTRYLGVLADETRQLDQVALETEARISPLVPSVAEFPDDYAVLVNTCDESLSNAKKNFEFDRVYGPHVGQAELFSDVQPLVQSALDGHNVSIFAYGQTHFGKTYTMTMDLLLETGKYTPKLSMGAPEYVVELLQEKVDNPLDFSAVLKTTLQTRENDLSKIRAMALSLYAANP
ncbi:hypothetical protein VNO78_25876 [Psophocarpus tetragonolobus]|uniref:Kinesin motor domain-containing protein n=1 Tax=Psophocarpus tetragonolobus TaxID=3891 RepID=A0AAN9XFT7_PSOTE